jgi:hypothetical protein
MRKFKKGCSFGAFLGCLLMALACGKSNDNTGTDSPATPAPNGPTTTSLHSTSEIASTADKRSLVDRAVDISDAKVQSVVGTYVFWAGEDSHTAIPVVRNDRINGPVTEHVKPGEHAAITGRIRLVDATAATDPMWDHISESERRDIGDAKVFIAAEKVSVIH